MIILSGILLTLCIFSSIFVMNMGISLNFPWGYVLSIGLIPIPIACYVARGGIQLENYLDRIKLAVPCCGILLGFLLVLFYNFNSYLFNIVWLVSFIFMVWFLIITKFTQVKYLLISLFLLIVGFTLVRNLNYLALGLVIDRLKDVSLYKIDMWCYSNLINFTTSYDGIFPLLKSKLIFEIFQNAYFMLFFEIYIVIFLMIHNKTSIAYFLYVLFGCYILGILVFLIYPAVGPYICYPNSFAESYRQSLAYKVMQGIVSGYDSVKNLSTPKNEVGYFVSFPSLHVALAVILQSFMKNNKLHFWIFLPINCLVIISTVYLGFHYLIDIPAGIIVALMSLAPYYVWKKIKLHNLALGSAFLSERSN